MRDSRRAASQPSSVIGRATPGTAHNRPMRCRRRLQCIAASEFGDQQITYLSLGDWPGAHTSYLQMECPQCRA